MGKWVNHLVVMVATGFLALSAFATVVGEAKLSLTKTEAAHSVDQEAG